MFFYILDGMTVQLCVLPIEKLIYQPQSVTWRVNNTVSREKEKEEEELYDHLITIDKTMMKKTLAKTFKTTF